MHVLSLVNQKGGCGKTTVAVNLAGALAARGGRVLLVDLDPQGHATMALGHAVAGGEPAALEVLRGEASLAQAAVEHGCGALLVPAGPRLAEFEAGAEREVRPEQALARALEPLRAELDVVLLDCPPRADGVLTANALRASDTAVLVVETGAFALQGAVQAARLLAELTAEGDVRYAVRVLGTLFDRRTRFAREVLVALHARFGDAMFETVVRQSVRLRETAALGVPVQQSAPRSRASADFHALAAEVEALVRSAALPGARTAAR